MQRTVIIKYLQSILSMGQCTYDENWLDVVGEQVARVCVF